MERIRSKDEVSGLRKPKGKRLRAQWANMASRPMEERGMVGIET